MEQEAQPVRYVVTHVAEKGTCAGLRVLTFAAQGRDTYATEEEARAALEAWRGPQGLPRVLSPRELASLDVTAVPCWPGHHDPTRTVFGK
jgi:hypothetical protein